MSAARNLPDPLFALGAIVATHGAIGALGRAGLTAWSLLNRHVAGDWGDIHPDDRGANEWALANDARILSVYPLPTSEVIWLITEADRSATTILLPSEH